MISPEEQAKIDAALDAALDELDSDDEDETISPPFNDTSHVAGPEANSGASLPSDHQLFTSMLQEMLDDGSGGDVSSSVNDFMSSGGGGIHENEVLGRFMQEIQSRLQSELTQADTIPKSPSTTKVEATETSITLKTSASNEEAVESVISNLVHGLSQQVTIDDEDGDDLPDMDNPELVYRFMENMMGPGMGNMDPTGSAFNPDAVINGMMEQLLCKDLMYEPMKQVATKFPQWLEEKRSVLSAEEYEMYVCFLLCRLSFQLKTLIVHHFCHRCCRFWSHQAQ
jgi:peroxin-19